MCTITGVGYAIYENSKKKSRSESQTVEESREDILANDVFAQAANVKRKKKNTSYGSTFSDAWNA